MYRKTYVEINCDKLENNIKKIIKTYNGYKYYFGVVKNKEKDSTKEEVKVEDKKEIEISKEFDDFSKTLKEKLKKYAIKSPEVLINITTQDLKEMKLSKKENKELATYVKKYLSQKKDE